MSLTRNCNELNTSILDQVEDDKIDKEIEETSDLKGDTQERIVNLELVIRSDSSSSESEDEGGSLYAATKNHTTLKGLVGISPGEAITFISQLYTSSISDREIVRRSGFLELPFDDKDSIMADKGFTIQDLLPLGVTLNLPPFLGASAQMAAEDVVATQEIASLRIHVERAINKIKK